MSTSETTIIEIDHLKKSFKEVKAVDDLSFSVQKGELFAFLGVNGAGKSTTINVISGILNKDSGKVRVRGEDIECNPERIKGKIGIVFQSSVLDKRLSVYENLQCRAATYGIFGEAFEARLAKLDEMLGLKEILNRPLVKLSGGQKRRADIARALLHDPELLILDEPTTGLDPQTRITVWNVIEKLRKERGLTVFLTTHYMEEAAVADYVVILDGGKKVAEGTPHELKSKYAADIIRFYDHINEAERLFTSLGYCSKRERDFLDVEMQSGTKEIAGFIAKYPEFFEDFEVLKGNMDNVFLKVTGKDLEVL